ncbi:MAG TPA: hypothetical protein VFG83_04190, partial [Kofleriaceae bacterium]|nr:hypothetical protein [Kofleriaceae bacterium]
ARLELGTATIGFHGEEKVTKSISALIDLERSLRGWTLDLRGEYRVIDQVSMETEYLQKSFDDGAEEDVSSLRFKAVWRWLIP